MTGTIEHETRRLLRERVLELEAHFEADVLGYYGPLTGSASSFLRVVESLVGNKNRKESLYLILTTSGGSASVVERYVQILRHNYEEVNFIIPDYAFSAGTIFALSGDRILMDYYSVLGPIDPQVENKEGKLVPALGYLDKINELLQKTRNNTISEGEFLLLKSFDLARMRSLEQARDLTLDLLQKWLVTYKFKNWTHHRTSSLKKGSQVTLEAKFERAKEIALALSDNNKWKSHARPIGIKSLRGLGLEIEDFGEDLELRTLIRRYQNLMVDFVSLKRYQIFYHTKKAK